MSHKVVQQQRCASALLSFLPCTVCFLNTSIWAFIRIVMFQFLFLIMGKRWLGYKCQKHQAPVKMIYQCHKLFDVFASRYLFFSLSLAGWKLGENYRGLRRKEVNKCSRSSKCKQRIMPLDQFSKFILNSTFFIETN